MLIDKYLTSLGFTVYQACDYDTAMDQLALGEIHLVVSDVQMPGSSGVDLLKAARQDRVDLPFYLVSAYAKRYESEARAVGATGIYNKDHIGELVDRIDKFYLKSFFPTIVHAN
jgi:CheY-like chemotaxis protein